MPPVATDNSAYRFLAIGDLSRQLNFWTPTPTLKILIAQGLHNLDILW